MRGGHYAAVVWHVVVKPPQIAAAHDLAVVASTWAASTWAVAAPARAGTLPQVWHHVFHEMD